MPKKLIGKIGNKLLKYIKSRPLFCKQVLPELKGVDYYQLAIDYKPIGDKYYNANEIKAFLDEKKNRLLC